MLPGSLWGTERRACWVSISMSISEIRRGCFWKVILIFLFLLLSIALIATWDTPATGYESSIYHSTPFILWLSLIFSIAVGITLVVVSTAKGEFNKTSLGKIGVLLVLLCYIVCLSLFIIRGYYMWRMPGDPAIHIGWIKETLSAGQTPTSLIYPIMHIYLTEAVLITGLDLLFLHKIVPLTFSITFIIFMYSFARTLFPKSTVGLLALLICCCPVYSWYLQLTPNVLANFFLPFVLFLLYKYIQQKSLAWAVPILVVLVVLPIFHALPAIIIVVTFLTLSVPMIFTSIKSATETPNKNTYNLTNIDYTVLLPFLIALIWWIFWMSLFTLFDQQIHSIYETLVLEQDDSWLSNFADRASYAQVHGYNVIEQVIRQLWGQILLCFMSLLSLPLIMRRTLHGHNWRYVRSTLLSFIIAVFLSIFFYFFNLAFTPQRFLFTISMFGTIFTAYLLSYLLKNMRSNFLSLKSLICPAFVVIFVFCLFTGGLLALYPSPYTLSTNLQNTHSEAAGVVYVLDHRNVDTPICEISGVIGRFSYAFLGPEERTIQRLPVYFEQQRIPSHFGYSNNRSISAIFTGETDIILTQLDKRMYIDTFPEMAEFRFTVKDFEQLEVDPGIHFIYSNGEFEYFKIPK